MRTIIDVHAHIFPMKIAEKAVLGIGGFYETRMKSAGSSEVLLEEERKAGVSRCVVHSVATVPQQVHSINDFIASECQKHPEFIGFGSLHPDMEGIEQEVERCISLGLKGIKLHPDFQRFLIDEERAMPIYQAIAGRMPLLVHTGDYRYEYSKPERLANVLDMFPKLDCIAAHFGGWSEQECALRFLLPKRCVVDCSSSFGFLRDRNRIVRLFKEWGAERVLFGCDFPMWHIKDELDYLLGCGLSEDELELVLHKNAEQLIGI